MNEQEGIAVGRSFAMFKHYNIDGNKEMVAIGTMNMVGSCFSCYLTTGLEKKKKKKIPLFLINTTSISEETPFILTSKSPHLQGPFRDRL